MKKVVKRISVALGLCILSLMLILGYGVWHTSKAVLSLSKYKKTEAKYHLSKSLPVARFFNTISAKNPDVLLWHHGLLSLQATIEIADYVESQTQEFFKKNNSISILPLQRPISILHQELTLINSNWKNSYVATHFAQESLENLLPILLELTSHALTVTNELADQKTHWLFLLQNSDELRATGGFMGSYILVPFENGVLKDIIVEDIYDADGQFTGFIPAPPGVDEYLSSQRGLRLPDANWSPDFASSAEIALQFFAIGNKREIGFVTAVTSKLVADIIAVTGPLVLPDYDAIITSSNFSQTLRATRDDFFPGSLQKKHILDQLVTQLRTTLTNADGEQLKKISAVVQDSLKNKNLQFFSLNQEIQKMWQVYGITGDLFPQKFETVINQCHCTPFFFAEVESNVGINKINPYVERSMAIKINDNQPEISLVFKNTATPLLTQEKTALGQLTSEREKKEGLLSRNYVNYQRIYLEPETKIIDISYNGKQIADWDEKVITTHTGKELMEIGFLVTVPAQTSGIVSIRVNTNRSTLPSYILLPKQAAVEPDLSITFRDKATQLKLDQDTIINLLDFSLN